MQIDSVRIQRFRGFKDFSLPLAQFANLVGQNSRGKTTVLQAIQFAFDTVARARVNANPSAASVRVDSSAEVARLSLTDTQSIWHHRDTSQPFKIELVFDNGYRLSLSNPANDQATISIFQDEIPIEAKRGPEWRELAEIADFGASYVPPIGATSGLELWRAFPTYEAARGQGLHSEIWRNSL